jgi:beta-galactosidase
MLYMLKPGAGDRLAAFVHKGGTLVTTYATGYVDENDRCFLGGFPGGAGSDFRKALGIWAEEIDSLYDTDRNSLLTSASGVAGKLAGLGASYEVRDFCELVHCEGAESLAVYGNDWYSGRPALTRNRWGKGTAYHIAARTGQDFLEDFYGAITAETKICGVLGQGNVLPQDVSATLREGAAGKFLFVLNFSAENRTVGLGKNRYVDLLTGMQVQGTIILGRYGRAVLKEEA